MYHSEQVTGVPKVFAAIRAVMLDLSTDGVAKSRKNTQQGYQFRGIDDMYNALSPLLAKHALLILPRMLKRECVERESRGGGALFYTTVEAQFNFISTVDGSNYVVGPMYGEAMDSGDKSTNKAMSAALKYCVMESFFIPTEGDNDADATTHEVTARQRAIDTKAANEYTKRIMDAMSEDKIPTAADILREAKDVSEALATAAWTPLPTQIKTALRNYSNGK
jgi:hypothetical protein